MMLLHLGTDVKIGLIESDYGGTPVQAWTPPDGLAACKMPPANCTTEPGGSCVNAPSKLFNSMIFPFVGLRLRSVLWYQGEANTNEGFPLSRDDYHCVFSQMIQQWRLQMKQPDMPFVFMQLSSWYGNWYVSTRCPAPSSTAPS
jgi:sialate O-acetylesterase